MEFKIGDKVIVTIPDWQGECGECGECTVVRMGLSPDIMFVCKANGNRLTIHKSWATKLVSKNQQLLFEFMND